MFYVIYGDNINKVRDRARETTAFLKNKKPEASYIEINDLISSRELEELAGSQGLFFGSVLVLFDGVLKTAEGREIFLNYLEALADSPNVFVILETGKIPVAVLRKLEKRAEKIEEHGLGFVKQDGGSGNFALADALGARDKKKSLGFVFKRY